MARWLLRIQNQRNAQRWQRVPSHVFSGSSSNDLELRANPALELDYIVAPPRMARYMEWSARIYQVYLRHVAPEDIHPYSIDEVFMDIAPYLQPPDLHRGSCKACSQRCA